MNLLDLSRLYATSAPNRSLAARPLASPGARTGQHRCDQMPVLHRLSERERCDIHLQINRNRVHLLGNKPHTEKFRLHDFPWHITLLEGLRTCKHAYYIHFNAWRIGTSKAACCNVDIAHSIRKLRDGTFTWWVWLMATAACGASQKYSPLMNHIFGTISCTGLDHLPACPWPQLTACPSSRRSTACVRLADAAT